MRGKTKTTYAAFGAFLGAMNRLLPAGQVADLGTDSRQEARS